MIPMLDREEILKELSSLYGQLGSDMEHTPSGIIESTMKTVRGAIDLLEEDEAGLKAAWDALKWKRLNPLEQIDEARDIIDDLLGRARINGRRVRRTYRKPKPRRFGEAQ